MSPPLPAHVQALRYLSLRDTMRVLRLGYYATRDLLETGAIRATRRGDRWYVAPDELRRYQERLPGVPSRLLSISGASRRASQKQAEQSEIARNGRSR